MMATHFLLWTLTSSDDLNLSTFLRRALKAKIVERAQADGVQAFGVELVNMSNHEERYALGLVPHEKLL